MFSSLELADRANHADPELQARLLADARAETARMARLVERLLLMARTGDEARAADQPVLIAELAADAGRRWQNMAEVARTFDVSGLGRAADVAVFGNVDQLQQVFDVLLENALEYTEPGTPVTLCADVDRDCVTITVTDHGVGIPDEELDHVFDRFHSGPDGGTGLGLAIARHIVESHGGSIVARRRDGGEDTGTSFVIDLPRWTDDAADMIEDGDAAARPTGTISY